MLQAIITSKTRLRLLVKFFINAANTGYLRGLASEMQENTNAIRKELNHLSDSGFIIREELDSKIMYRANAAHPFFEILQQMVRKYVGIDDIVERIFERIGAVSKVYLIGDYAKGLDTGTIEIVIVGENLDQDYLDQMALKLSKEIDKKIILHVSNSSDVQGLLVFEI